MTQGTDAYNSKANGSRKLYVITGGTSGIGRGVVARLLADWQNHRIIVVARPSPRISRLRALPGAYERLSVVDGDLSSLRSIAKACEEIQGMLGSDRIDVLGLNAGVQVVRGDASSSDGFELSFAVNFLAHFLIVERLKWLLRPAGRIVFTSSEVRDPDAFCLMGITRVTWQDPLVLADVERSQNHIASPVDRGEARNRRRGSNFSISTNVSAPPNTASKHNNGTSSNGYTPTSSLDCPPTGRRRGWQRPKTHAIVALGRERARETSLILGGGSVAIFVGGQPIH